MASRAEKKIDALREEIIGIEKYVKPLEDLGLDALWVPGAGLISVTANNFEDIAALDKAYPPTTNFVLTYAGKPEKPTESPYSIHVDNWNGTKDVGAKVKWRHNEIQIWIKIPLFMLEEYVNVSEVTRRIAGGGVVVEGHNYSIRVASALQPYAGAGKYGSRVNFANSKEDANAFMAALGVNGIQGGTQ